jgi:hypothetical protein
MGEKVFSEVDKSVKPINISFYIKPLLFYINSRKLFRMLSFHHGKVA